MSTMTSTASPSLDQVAHIPVVAGVVHRRARETVQKKHGTGLLVQLALHGIRSSGRTQVGLGSMTPPAEAPSVVFFHLARNPSAEAIFGKESPDRSSRRSSCGLRVAPAGT